jgi:hypothetical protein
MSRLRLKDFNIDGINFDHCCDYVMMSTTTDGEFYCNKYDRVIGYKKEGSDKVVQICARVYKTQICYFEKNSS